MAVNNDAGTWFECVVDNDYEINDQYPNQIRRKGSDKVVSEFNTNGYLRCTLNQKIYQKHRIVASQFIPNPNNLPEVDHINGISTDNHIENLRWVTKSDNLKNRSSIRGKKFVFIDELPETAESLDSYNGHDFDGLFVDYDDEKLYLFNGARYREVTAYRSHGNICYNIKDIEGKRRWIAHKVLFG